MSCQEKHCDKCGEEIFLNLDHVCSEWTVAAKPGITPVSVISSEWLDSECVKPAASGDGVASQRSRGRDDNTRTLNVAYADPPYEGESKQHYGNHKDFAGEVNYADLVRRLAKDYPDGWALSMKQATLRSVLNICVVELGLKVKIGVWCKRNPTFKKNVNPTYAWEPVVFCGGRRRPSNDDFLLDWIDCAATFDKRPLHGKIFVGRKPEKFCYWVFSMLGLNRHDELTDIYEGTGSVGWAWKCYKEQTSLWEVK